jgi:hypothetical protein
MRGADAGRVTIERILIPDVSFCDRVERRAAKSTSLTSLNGPSVIAAFPPPEASTTAAGIGHGSGRSFPYGRDYQEHESHLVHLFRCGSEACAYALTSDGDALYREKRRWSRLL